MKKVIYLAFLFMTILFVLMAYSVLASVPQAQAGVFDPSLTPCWVDNGTDLPGTQVAPYCKTTSTPVVGATYCKNCWATATVIALTQQAPQAGTATPTLQVLPPVPKKTLFIPRVYQP